MRVTADMRETRPSRPKRCDVWIVERMRYQPTDRPTDTASYKGVLSHLKRMFRSHQQFNIVLLLVISTSSCNIIQGLEYIFGFHSSIIAAAMELNSRGMGERKETMGLGLFRGSF